MSEKTRRQVDIAAMDEMIQSNLKLGQEIVTRLAFLPEVAQFLSRRLKAISERYNSKQVVMAVMGEFSVGKSTLINALLGERVLTSKAVPTTAILTYIRYGNAPKAVVLTEDGREISVSPHNLDPYLTGAHKVRSVTLCFPNELLKQGLVIIDTPGFNATGAVGIEHYETARRAIAEANACLFVFNGTQPFSKSSAGYLDELRKNVTKFAFVMSKTDEIDESELDEALDYARRQIAERMKSSSLEVIPISAKKALDGDRVSSNMQYLWDTLSDMMKHDKNRIVLQDILDLQMDLLSQVNGILEDRERMYENELSEILGKEVTVEGLKNEAVRIIREGVPASIGFAERSFIRMKDETISGLRSSQSAAIMNAGSPEDLRRTIESIRSRLVKVQEELIAVLSQGMQACYTRNLWSLQEFFRTAFSDLQTVRDVKRKRRREFLGRLFSAIKSGGLVGFILFLAYEIFRISWLKGYVIWGALVALWKFLTSARRHVSEDLTQVGLAQLQTACSVSDIKLDIQRILPVGTNLFAAIGAAVWNLVRWLFKSHEIKAQACAEYNRCLAEFDKNITAVAAYQFARKRDEIIRILESQIDSVIGVYRDELESIMTRQEELRSRIEGRRNAISQVIADVKEAMVRSSAVMPKA